MITVGSGAHVHTEQLNRIRSHNRTQLVLPALDVLASKCRILVLQTTLKITVSCLDSHPSIHVTLRITVVSSSTHQHLFKQELPLWSATGEVSTSDHSFLVQFVGPNNTTTKKEDANSAYAVHNLVMLSLVLSTFF